MGTLQPSAAILFTFFLPEAWEEKWQRLPCYWRDEDEEFI